MIRVIGLLAEVNGVLMRMMIMRVVVMTMVYMEAAAEGR
jgi:hypothetical protein